MGGRGLLPNFHYKFKPTDSAGNGLIPKYTPKQLPRLLGEGWGDGI